MLITPKSYEKIFCIFMWVRTGQGNKLFNVRKDLDQIRHTKENPEFTKVDITQKVMNISSETLYLAWSKEVVFTF